MKKCILYGAASIGLLAKESLKKCGYEVVGYIDKRAFELSTYNGLPVWEIGSVPRQYVKDDVMIYVSVKNVFEHEKIARNLVDAGFQYIVYKPYSVLLGIGNAEERYISQIYDELFAGNCQEELHVKKLQLNKKAALHDYGMICENDEMVTAYIPAEFIFTNDYRDTPMTKWGNICILALFTHINFWRFLENYSNAGLDAYVQEYCVFTAGLQKRITVTDAWKENVIENRIQIYEQMRESLELDANFFVRNAAEAEWNYEKKYFNLISGKHRCTFLAAMGKKYIPIKMKKTDYSEFLNFSEIDTIESWLISVKEEILIPHPYFYRGVFSRDRSRSEWCFFLWFARYYGEKSFYKNTGINFTTISITDYSNDSGNFARFAKRMGCRVIRKIEPDTIELQLNKLFYADSIYDVNSENGTEHIVVIEAKQLEIAEMLGENNSIIVKYGLENTIKDFAEKNQYSMVSLINKRYQEGNWLYSYLLEK